MITDELKSKLNNIRGITLKLPKLPFWLYWTIFFIPLILIYSKFLQPKIGEMFGPNMASGLFVGIIIVFVAGTLLDSFSMIFRGFTNPFLGSGKKAKYILENGIPATATVLSLGENSKGGTVTINDQPYLNIKLKIDDYKNKPYEISFDTVIPRSDVPQFQIGAFFPVKIDPNDPKVVVIDINALSHIYITDEDNNITEDDKKEIMTNGIDAKAVLISLKDTGKSKDFKPIAEACWEITINNNDKYNIIIKSAVAYDKIEEIKKILNVTFSAKVHPKNRNKVKIEMG